MYKWQDSDVRFINRIIARHFIYYELTIIKGTTIQVIFEPEEDAELWFDKQRELQRVAWYIAGIFWDFTVRVCNQDGKEHMIIWKSGS